MFSERKLGLRAERLRELLHYAPETGLFYWRVSRGSVAAGMPAGRPHSDGYAGPSFLAENETPGADHGSGRNSASIFLH